MNSPNYFMILPFHCLRLIAIMWMTIVAVNVQSASAGAADDKNACGLLTALEIESLLGTEVALKGMALTPTTHICTGETSNTQILLRLVTDLDPDRDRSGRLEKVALETMVKKRGGKAEVKTFGSIVCFTLEPPTDDQPMEYSTTCTANKERAMAGIEITTTNKRAILPIERLLPVAQKMTGRL